MKLGTYMELNLVSKDPIDQIDRLLDSPRLFERQTLQKFKGNDRDTRPTYFHAYCSVTNRGAFKLLPETSPTALSAAPIQLPKR
jgi:hypothetical protein